MLGAQGAREGDVVISGEILSEPDMIKPLFIELRRMREGVDSIFHGFRPRV